MDKLTVVSGIEQAHEVLGICAKSVKAYGSARGKSERAKVSAAESLHKAGFRSEWCESPYIKGGNNDKLREDIDQTETFEFHGEQYTRAQLFNGLKLTLAEGYLTPAQFALFQTTAEERKGLAESKRKEYGPIVKNVGSIIGDIKKGLIAKEENKALQDAQDAEDKAAEAEGREPKLLTKSDLGLGKGAKDKRPVPVRAGEKLIQVIKMVQSDETPDYDVSQALSYLRSALVEVFKQEDTTLDK